MPFSMVKKSKKKKIENKVNRGPYLEEAHRVERIRRLNPPSTIVFKGIL
jgi:hypothetical protein